MLLLLLLGQCGRWVRSSMGYETDITKSGWERKAFKLSFRIDAAAEDFIAEAKLALFGCAS